MQGRHRIPAPVRCWRTGTVAVVMAALAGPRLATAQPMASYASRYGVEQTAQRIEASARRHGLALFTSVSRADAGARDVLVLVLESPQGGTPVLMEGEGGELRSEVPLRLELSERADGAAEVRHPAAADLPDELAADLASLPELVAEALAD
ncbi:MAG: hypothetical protein ACM3N6_16300 [Betaproteobacteria bacterium]